MATNEEQRHRMIERLVGRPAAAPLDACVALWQGLALQLNAIIGEGGFESLYNRSAHLARRAHPWLAPSAGRDFGALRDSLAQQDAGQAGEACSALLIFFTDTLILLIGELLTTSILRAAWGDDAVNTAGKEPQP
ncbi:hypothetical protein [Rugamonas sp. DEMB1]|uniref:hypothetical protein n=1 Tax=Rugamonas sp. DEMB1 TaxID=3039386 RepID=UPI00244C7169|nr:hypothetical protein [Rugamonas sp. DEMB1]WGG48849.1 hypothetical protein QC826_19655 [Rugamonas sp. DEMB1]